MDALLLACSDEPHLACFGLYETCTEISVVHRTLRAEVVNCSVRQRSLQAPEKRDFAVVL